MGIDAQVAATWEEIGTLTPWDQNPRHNATAVDSVAASIERFGFGSPIIARESDRVVIAGHTRLQAAQKLGLDKVPVRFLDLDPAQARALALADNRIGEIAEWDDDMLSRVLAELNEEIDLDGLGWSDEEIQALLDDKNIPEFNAEKIKSMEDQYGVPPFSVLDSKQGYWQDRKREWNSIGLKSNEGRADNLLGTESDHDCDYTDPTSIFDPVLCELMYRWFCPANGSILDPFAGGSVRGIVASILGLSYTGIELRNEQVSENEKQGQQICSSSYPNWIIGDSLQLDTLIDPESRFDFVFGCPPYSDLEQYSNDPKDLSNMEYSDFLKAYFKIISLAVSKLKPDRFAVFVVGDIRDKDGFYRNFPGETIQAFLNAGMILYNEAILLTSLGSLPLRAGRPFRRGRKLGKAHQNVFVFFKGDPKQIPEIYGEIDLGFASEEE